MPIHGYPGNVITANPVAPTASVATGVWTTEQQLQAVSQGNWPGYEYPISRSLRFNSADSAYLNRTPASASNRKTWTWSGWVKKSALGSLGYLFSVPDSTGHASLRFTTSDTLEWAAFTAANGAATTNAVFRDASAWYHIVFAMDTTQATTTNRIKLYVNNVLQTFSSYTAPTQNQDTPVNNTVEHDIGKRVNVSEYLSSYLTEINFIDGQALEPSSFGLNDPETGVWSPKRYTGTYGTNGFYLNFSDNSGTTSTTLGKDNSGNGNNWTPNGFSVTAGAGNDSLVDSPTAYGTDTGVGGEVRGNYCTFCPTYGATPTLANGNLEATTNNTTAYGSISFTSGKWYWEITVGNANYIGVMDSTYIKTDNNWGSQAVAYVSNGNKYNGTGSAYGASYTTNDVIGVAIDMDAGTIAFYKNGSSQGTAFSSGLAGREFRPLVYSPTSGTQTANFGQRPFAYTAPSGFKALCTQNLPTPTIGATSTTQANDYFNVVLWTGNGSDPRNITGVGFAPDFVWGKSRSSAYNHRLYDIVRGAQKALLSNATDAETTADDTMTAFLSDGFTVKNSLNTNADTYVSWNWNAGGSNATNTAGSITSTVRANTTSGFSIVTYTGTGSAATIGHGLGVAPSMIIVKNRQAANSWAVYHISTGANQQLILNSTNGISSDTQGFTAVPSSTVFSVGTGAAMDTNQTSGGGQHVAYCFAPVAGYSAFGSYTGNGSADGPFVYTGFRPRYVLVKRTDTGGAGFDWFIWDTARSTYNVASANLTANQTVAEGVTAYPLDINSNGLKIRNSATAYNASGGTYIYACFAENKYC